MRDPIQELEDFSAPERFTVIDPSPAGARRRGAQIRRRRAAVGAAGCAALAAAIAVPLAASTMGSPVHEQRQQTGIAGRLSAPPSGWTTSIADDFALGEGMGKPGDPPAVGRNRGDVVIGEVSVCGHVAWTSDPSGSSTDALGASWFGGSEDGRFRTLTVYPDADAAAASLGAIRGAVQDCATVGDHGSSQTLPLETANGDESVAYFDGARDSNEFTDGFGAAFVITRVGNALLIDEAYFDGVDDPDAAQQAVDRMDGDARSVVDAMCIYAVDPC